MHRIVEFIHNQLKLAQDPQQAQKMQSHMKTEQFFFGVLAPKRKLIFYEAVKQFHISSFEEYTQSIQELWNMGSREEMYFALDIALYYEEHRTHRAMFLYQNILETATNWDTVDIIASQLIGLLILDSPEYENQLLQWAGSDSPWIKRAAILTFLPHKHQTNIQLLEQILSNNLSEKDVFIQKAIGWVLREYAKINASWVKIFMNKYEYEISKLTKREVLKQLAF